MITKQIICTICPIGCVIDVTGEGENITSLEGNKCKRGEKYATDEFIAPVRILTSTVKIEGSDTPLVSVRTNRPIPKDMLMKCMEEIRKVSLKAPIKRNDIIIKDVLGTGSDVVATSNAYRT